MDVVGDAKNSHHLELQSAIQERHRIAAVDPSRFYRFTQQQDSRFKSEPSYGSALAGGDSKRDEIWPSWRSDDSKRNSWLSRSQDNWRETQRL